MLAPAAGVEELAAVLRRLIADRDRLAAMARAARGLGRAGAAEAIADRVEHLGRAGRSEKEAGAPGDGGRR